MLPHLNFGGGAGAGFVFHHNAVAAPAQRQGKNSRLIQNALQNVIGVYQRAGAESGGFNADGLGIGRQGGIKIKHRAGNGDADRAAA